MNFFSLYTRYTLQELLGGSLRTITSSTGNIWISTQTTVLCLLNTEPQTNLYFYDARVLFIDEPIELAVTGSDRLPIQLFSQTRQSRVYIYLGQSGPSHKGFKSLTLSQPIPEAVFADIVDLETLKANPNELDRDLSRELDLWSSNRAHWDALDGRIRAIRCGHDEQLLSVLSRSLSIVDELTPAACSSLLEHLVEYWHGPLSQASGFTEGELCKLVSLLGTERERECSEGEFLDRVCLLDTPMATFDLPAPLIRFYRFAGRRMRQIFRRHSRFALEPLDEHNRLPIYTDPDNYRDWTIELGTEDPVVWTHEWYEGDWIKEDLSLSQFLIMAVLRESILSAFYSCDRSYVCGHDDAGIKAEMDDFIASLTPIRLPTPVLQSAKFYYSGGLFVMTTLSSGGPFEEFFLYCGAKTESAYSPTVKKMLR